MRFLVVSLALFCLAGCVSLKSARSLGSLQAEFGDIARTEADCAKPDAFDEVCLGGFKAMYGLIETQAADTIDTLKNSTDLGDQQITIALYRLAAFASLKADTNKASDYGNAGSTICESLAGAAPPRDCALLGVVGQYEVAEEFANAVICLRTDDCTAKQDPNDLASGYCSNFNKLMSKTESAKKQPLLPDVVNNYLDQQVARFEISAQSLADHLITGLSLHDIPKKPCECVNLNSDDPAFATDCGNLPAAKRMATFKAMCIRKSLDETPPNCPGF